MIQQHRQESSLLTQWVHEYENDPEFIADGLAADVIEDALNILKKRKLNKKWLAETMNISLEELLRIFEGNSCNLTIVDLVKLSVALGTKLKVTLDSENIFL